MNGVANYTSAKDKNIGFVIVSNDNYSTNTKEDSDKAIGTYIPKLMSEINMGTGPWIKQISLSSTMIKNNNFKFTFKPVINSRNYYNVSPLRISNMEQPSLSKGEHFWVKFLDGDLKKPTYEPRFMDENNRTSDRMRLFVKDKNSVSDDSSKEYEILADSKEQVIRLFMSNGRGEKQQYTIEINGQKGEIAIKDDAGQEINLNSNGTLTMKNSQNAITKIQGKVISHSTSSCSVILNGNSETVNLCAAHGVFANGNPIG